MAQAEIRSLSKSPGLAAKALEFVSQFEAVCCRLCGMIVQSPGDVFAVVDEGRNVRGVFSYTPGHLVLPCLPDDDIAVRDAMQDFFYNHRVFCISGMDSFCRTACAALDSCAVQSVKERRNFDFFECEIPSEPREIQGMSFFKCTRKDCQQMIGIQLEYIREEVLPAHMSLNPPAERMTLDRLVKEGSVYGLKDSDGLICAKAQINARSSRYALVGGVYVSPAYRRKGLASYMMSRLVKEISVQGRRTVLFADRNNPASLALYRSLGFSCISGYSICYYE